MSDHKIWTWRRHPRNCQNQAWELWIARSLLEKLLGASAWIAVASHNLKITWSPGTKDLTTFLESRKHSQTLWSSQPKILCYFLPLWKISESLFFSDSRWRTPWRYGMTESPFLNVPALFFKRKFCRSWAWDLRIEAMWKIIGAANAKKEEPNGSGKPDIQPEAKPEAKKAFSCVGGLHGPTMHHMSTTFWSADVPLCLFSVWQANGKVWPGKEDALRFDHENMQETTGFPKTGWKRAVDQELEANGGEMPWKCLCSTKQRINVLKDLFSFLWFNGFSKVCAIGRPVPRNRKPWFRWFGTLGIELKVLLKVSKGNLGRDASEWSEALSNIPEGIPGLNWDQARIWHSRML